MNVTIVRPWYVLGPGHRWPYALLPMYWLCERIPSTRDGVRRLGLVTLPQMTRTLVSAIENPVLASELSKSRKFGPESQPPELLGIPRRSLELRKRMHMGHLLACAAR